DVGGPQPGHLAHEVHQQHPVFHVGGHRVAVDRDLDLHSPLPASCARASLACASLMAAHTRCGVVGMSICRTPRWASASMTAFCPAGVAPIVPASPMPLAPSGFTVVGVWLVTSSKLGSSAAVMNA